MLTAAGILLTACSSGYSPVRRVAVIAPFEGRYREVGYDVLYSLRLGLQDSSADIVLTAIDISREAPARAAALASDPTIVAVIVAGPQLEDGAVMDSLVDVPTLVIGHWGAADGPNRWIMTAPTIPAEITAESLDFARTLNTSQMVVGGDLYSLRQAALTIGSDADVEILSSARWPSSEFVERVVASDMFVPAPRLHSTLAYDAGRLIGTVLKDVKTRRQAAEAIAGSDIDGLNGPIRFDAEGYWLNAPVYRYRIVGETLELID